MLSNEEILAAGAVETVDLAGFGEKTRGKVRDIYSHDDHLLLITTDRVSAFDRVLGTIPWLTAMPGIPRRAAVVAAPTVPEIEESCSLMFCPKLMPDTTRSGGSDRSSRIAM